MGAILTKRRFMVCGMACAGENNVAKVEVSTGTGPGAAWLPAVLSPPRAPYNWVPWSFDRKIPRAGEYSLTVRATDHMGRQNPTRRAADRVDASELNHFLTVQHMILGLIAAQNSQWDQSSRCFQTVPRLDPSNPFGYFYLGQADRSKQKRRRGVLGRLVPRVRRIEIS